MKTKPILLLMLIANMATSAFSQQARTKQHESSNQMETKMKTMQLTKAEFLAKVADFETHPTEWKYLGDKPAIVDFYADWCGPCKMVAPILEELADEYEGQLYIYKIDTDKERELAAAFGIRSIPTLLFIPLNEAPQIAQGALHKSDFKKAIKEVLLKQ